MYRIDNIHDAAMEVFFQSFNEGKIERWMAASAWWFFRQGIGNSQEFWSSMAAKLTSELSEADRLEMLEQLSKTEDVMVAEAAGWPEVPQSLVSYMARWYPVKPEPNIEEERAKAVKKVDREAENHRMNFITAGFGQVMTYQQKIDEARAVSANPEIDENEIPHIVSEAAVSGVDIQEKSAEIISTFEMWRLISSSIEGKRMAAKKWIAEAQTVEAVQMAASVDWLEQNPAP